MDIKGLKASNLAVRQWYKEHVASIPSEVDPTLALEERARQAFALRNQYRVEARNLMENQAQRRILDVKSPNADFDGLLQSKMVRKNMTREEALQDILDTASKTNASVDNELGV